MEKLRGKYHHPFVNANPEIQKGRKHGENTRENTSEDATDKAKKHGDIQPKLPC